MTQRAVTVLVVLALLVGACRSATQLPTAAPSLQASPSRQASPSPSAPAAPSASAVPSGDPTPRPTAAPIPSPVTAVVPGTADRTSLALEATYDADLEVQVGVGAVAVEVTIHVRNVSGGPVDRLELNTVAARLGGIVLAGTTVDGRPAEASVNDQTITVPLGGILPDGASTIVTLAYRATLRADLEGSDWLFSRAGGTIAMYRWIPWISRAVPFDRPNHGDPFVTPSSPRVRVMVTTNVPMVLASPGRAPTVRGLTSTFEVTDVRDVAIVLAPDFIETVGDAGGIPVRVYTRPGGLDRVRLAELAALAIGRIAHRLGVPYPGAVFTVAETAGGSGMESPGLIWIPRQTTRANLAYLVHHEAAHQWFYGLVGNDQQAEPFADEAPADLVARTVLGILRTSRCATAPLDRPITRYSAACYYEVIYIQGGNVLDDARRRMGTSAFWAAIRGYLEDHRFGLGSTRALLTALVDVSSVDLGPLLRARFPSLY